MKPFDAVLAYVAIGTVLTTFIFRKLPELKDGSDSELGNGFVAGAILWPLTLMLLAGKLVGKAVRKFL